MILKIKYTALIFIVMLFVNSCTTSSKDASSVSNSRSARSKRSVSNTNPANNHQHKNRGSTKQQKLVEYPSNISSIFNKTILDAAEQKVYNEKIKVYGGFSPNSTKNLTIYLLKGLTEYQSSDNAVKFTYIAYFSMLNGCNIIVTLYQEIIIDPKTTTASSLSIPQEGVYAIPTSTCLRNSQNPSQEIEYTEKFSKFNKKVGMPTQIDSITLTDEFMAYNYSFTTGDNYSYLINTNTLELVSIKLNAEGKYDSSIAPKTATLLRK